MNEASAEPKKRGRKPLPPEERQRRGRKKVVHQEIQERKNQGAPPLQISFICSTSENSAPAAALTSSGTKATTPLNPFLDGGAFAVTPPVTASGDLNAAATAKPRLPPARPAVAARNGGQMLLDESDDDELHDVRARPRVDVSQLTGEKCIEILGAHTDVERWPERTEMSCWNCTYPFDGIPIMIPGKMHKITDKLVDCFGVFCSFNCAKRYCVSHGRHSSIEQVQLLSYLHKKVLGATARVTPAPPFQALSRFGGYMDIDEYRKDAITLPPDESMFDPAVRRDHVTLLQYHCVPLFQTVLHTHNQMMSNSVRERAVRKQMSDRTKPLPGSQELANSMGIVCHHAS